MQAPMTEKVRRRERRSVHASQLLVVAAEASRGPCQMRPGAEGSGWRSVRKAAMAWTWPGRLERRASMRRRWWSGFCGAILVEEEAHGDHLGMDEAVFLEEALGFLADAVGEEGDAAEVFFGGEFLDVVDESGAVAVAAVFGADDDVFHEDDEAAFCGADGEEEIDHADDLVVIACDEDAAAVGLFEDEAEAVALFVGVRVEVGFDGHEGHDEVRQFGEVLQSGGFDADRIRGGFHGRARAVRGYVPVGGGEGNGDSGAWVRREWRG